MVVCIAALVVLAFLGLFSAKYRQWAKEALACVGRKVTLRPCETGFDTKVRAASVGWLLKRNKSLARFVHKRFELLSWLFMLSFIISIALVTIGLYNWYAFGNCNGEQSEGFCIYNALTGQPNGGGNPDDLLPPENLLGVSFGNPDAPVTLVEFGCFTCPYTREAEVFIRDILEQYPDEVYYVFKPFPIPGHTNSLKAAEASLCAQEQGSYWEYRALLFKEQEKCTADPTDVPFLELAEEAGLDAAAFSACLNGGRYEGIVSQTFEEGRRIGIYGTPTFFVNRRPVVGPDEEAVRQAIEEALD